MESPEWMMTKNGYVDDTIGWDFVDWDNQPEDLSGHGTQVAGIISADPSNQEGITGIAPDSFIVPLRVFG
jgi:subtilisin family serine protease